MTVDPIVHTYDLACGVEDAFDVYTRRIGEWWHPAYSADPDTLEVVRIEPRVDGRVFATHAGGEEFDWGRVTGWEPPRLLAHTFTLAMSAEHPSLVTVEFGARADGCHVRFEHGGWHDGNAGFRSKYGDWPVILDRFVALTDRPAAG